MLPWPSVKIVFLGDGAVGKTSLVLTYVNDNFPGEYIQYVAERCSKHRMFEGKPFTLDLWDTPELHASWFNITTRNSAVLVDSHQKLNKLKVDDLPTVNVSLLAQDGYDRLRPTCYPETDVFFICFSMETPTSLESVTKKWYPEVRRHCPNTPIFLVGTKLDLRNDEKVIEHLKSHGLSPVTTSQGMETKEAIGACKYIECSSLTRENLETLFDEVLRFVHDTSKRKKRCAIM